MFLLRFYAAPKKEAFLFSFKTYVEVIVISSFILLVALANTHMSTPAFLQRLIRLTFSFRILAVSRHSLLLCSLGISLKEASRDLFSVLIFVFVFVFLFACFEFFLEVKEPEPNATVLAQQRSCNSSSADHDCHSNTHNYHVADEHHSIIDYCWWSLITITTIGYGDEPHVKSTPGKIVAAMCAISGVFLFAIPIPILSKHLERVDMRERKKNKRMNVRMRRLSQRMLPSEEEEDDLLIEEEEETDDGMPWKKIVGVRRKSMGPQFSMTHFSNPH
jgi:hypothetical protein